MGFLRTPLALGVRVARRGLELDVDVAGAVIGRVLPGQRSAVDTVWVMPTAPSRPDPRARAGSAAPGDPSTEEAELVAAVGDPDDVGATVHVEGEPFPGYDMAQRRIEGSVVIAPGQLMERPSGQPLHPSRLLLAGGDRAWIEEAEDWRDPVGSVRCL